MERGGQEGAKDWLLGSDDAWTLGGVVAEVMACGRTWWVEVVNATRDLRGAGRCKCTGVGWFGGW